MLLAKLTRQVALSISLFRNSIRHLFVELKEAQPFQMRELAEVSYKREIMELHRELATLKARGLEITASY